MGVTGIILEHSFRTNTAATNWLLDEGNLRKLAAAEAGVIADYYGVTGIPVTRKTPIMGASVATVEQMAAYLTVKNPGAAAFALEYAKLYLAEGATEGVRGDIAFAQSCLETGFWKFGGDVKPEQNNFAGKGLRFRA